MHLPSKESLHVEFKSERSGPIDDSTIINNVVAFANTRGGTLYLGVEDDGRVTGVSPQHRNISQLAAFVFNNTVPPTPVRPSVLNVDGHSVVAITVDESSQLTCTKSGRVIHRVLKADGEPEIITMYPYEFISRLSSIKQYDYSAQPAPGASLDDLDPRARDLLREGIARTHADDQLLSLTDADFDGAIGLTVRDIRTGAAMPTIAGIVTIGTQHALRQRAPSATATFQVMRDGKPVTDETLRLPLVTMLPRIEELLTPWNKQTEVMLGLHHANYDDIDRDAFREAMINAFCHRDYTILGPVRFQLDETGLTIANPGGFMRGVSLGNLLTTSPTPRNQQLADILKRCGYVERTGRGIDRIFARTVAAGRPLPDYSQSTPEAVVLLLRTTAVDEHFIRTVNALTDKRQSPLPIESLIVLAALRQYGALRSEDIRARTSLDQERVSVAISDLETLHAIEKQEKTYSMIGSGTSIQADETPAATGFPQWNPRRSSRQVVQNVMNYMREKSSKEGTRSNGVSVTQIADHLGVSYATASRLLKRMLADGLISHQGAARKSRYYLNK
ncbi:RNA-binding domain-containing protein [Bifidobacterium platyrrhinorum]|uniref:MarR family transcriptional regulator n=1 Tax=Bifidobacterium platyrrhinorum TaxID=2661628 RepID=A0A6L9SS38_9BIFI|nr:RNA-binding domain-containing protein [Bifidobacterium platyrrhinorum]NEG54859.1 MarR family transcriptional regulator [Bifidobacterium platyrrhinorum]